jgi:hypothetical protein
LDKKPYLPTQSPTMYGFFAILVSSLPTNLPSEAVTTALLQPCWVMVSS